MSNYGTRRRLQAVILQYPAGAFRARGFTVMELMIVIAIMAIAGVAALDSISSFEANQRADRAARESLSCFRFAQNLAMSTGRKAKVDINTANRTISVYWQSNGSSYDATPYTTGSTSSGTWLLNLNNKRELVGTAVSLNPSGTSSFEYTALGSCSQTGTVTFTYAGRTKSIVVANVGDPRIQ